MFRALFIAVGISTIVAGVITFIDGSNKGIGLGIIGLGIFLFGYLLPKSNGRAPVEGEYHVVHKHKYPMIWNLAKFAAIISAIVGAASFFDR